MQLPPLSQKGGTLSKIGIFFIIDRLKTADFYKSRVILLCGMGVCHRSQTAFFRNDDIQGFALVIYKLCCIINLPLSKNLTNAVKAKKV